MTSSTLEQPVFWKDGTVLRKESFGGLIARPQHGVIDVLSHSAFQYTAYRLHGANSEEACEKIAKRYGISPEQVRTDMKIIEHQLSNHGYITN
ncbi:MAG: hypothetical protein Q4A92_01400 [Corynebacterium sp.]|nr:hypothetical protein [Corynebacterium sp.]